MRISNSRPHPCRGFTLIEVMVATVILVLIFVLILQIVNGASRVATMGQKILDADNQARMVFDRMAFDFEAMLKRPDADAIFSKSAPGGNDAIFFYSEAPASMDPSSSGALQMQGAVALVGYRVNTANHPFQLERLGKGLTWDGAAGSAPPGGPVYLNYPNGISSPPALATTLPGNWPGTFGQPPYTTGTDADYQVISDQVYRMDFCFLMSTGSFFTPAPLTSGSTWRSTQGFKDVAAVVVTIAILDGHSRQMLPASQFNTIMQNAVTALPPSNTAATPGNAAGIALQWMSVANSGGGLGTGGPSAAIAGQIRVYQRYFYLNTN